MLIALSSPPKRPRLTYSVQKVQASFVVVDADGVEVDRLASEPAARLVLARVRRERAAYELVEDRIATLEKALVA